MREHAAIIVPDNSATDVYNRNVALIGSIDIEVTIFTNGANPDLAALIETHMEPGNKRCVATNRCTVVRFHHLRPGNKSTHRSSEKRRESYGSVTTKLDRRLRVR